MPADAQSDLLHGHVVDIGRAHPDLKCLQGAISGWWIAGRPKPHLALPWHRGEGSKALGLGRDTLCRSLAREPRRRIGGLMSDVTQGPGWWQATDGKWYAPELHPQYQAPPPPPASTQAPPPGAYPYQAPGTTPDGALPPGGEGAPKKKRTGLIVGLSIGAVVVLIIIVAAVASGTKKNNTPSAASGPNSTVATGGSTPATTKPGPSHVGATLNLSGDDGRPRM